MPWQKTGRYLSGNLLWFKSDCQTSMLEDNGKTETKKMYS